MEVINRMGRIKAVGLIENGCLFKSYFGCYYIATNEHVDDRCRLCVNVNTGYIIPFQIDTVVETLEHATIKID